MSERINLLRYFSPRTIATFGQHALERFVMASMNDAEWSQGLSIDFQGQRAKIKRATFAGARECKTRVVAQYRTLLELANGAEHELILEKLYRCPD